MAEPFLAEVRIMCFVFAPKGWALCNGQLLPINQNQALFSLLGTTFGGDGRVNFALPDLRGRTPIHVGSGHTLGERGGEQAHTLSIAELPTHTHVCNATSANATTQHPPRTIVLRARVERTCTRAADNLVSAECLRSVTNCRWQPGPPEHAAVPDAEFLHRAAGHLPVPELRRRAMAQPYVGEIRMFAGNFAPAGWMFCEGQLLPISENETLFQLIGTTYGGDGESTFALPDLRGRIPIHQGNGFILAETGGAEEITLTVNQITGAQLIRCWRRLSAGNRHIAARQRAVRSLRRDVIHRTALTTRRNMSPRRRSRRWAAASRTRISSRTCASTSSSRCSGFSRPRHREAIGGESDETETLNTKERTMADPFVAEIRIFPFNFAPKGWAWCDGQLLPLSQNTALFSLLGTTYGGDGKIELRAARPAGPCADASRPGAGAVAARSGRDRRFGDRDAAGVRDPVAHVTRCARRAADGISTDTGCRHAGAGIRQQSNTPLQRTDCVAEPQRLSRRPAATSRTTTCSRT